LKLRPYQHDCIESVERELEDARSALAVAATGTGKTVIMAHIAKREMQRGRVMMIAHREELLTQAQDKFEAVIGDRPSLEQAGNYAGNGIFDRARCVIASVQTLNTAKLDEHSEPYYRYERFDPFSFNTLMIDEAHHATATTYRRIIEHFTQNPQCKIIGVTATPDRADEEALGQVFESVAFVYEINNAIADGWLVPVNQRLITVQGMDFSGIKTTAGDLNKGELAAVLEEEENIHSVVQPTIDLTKGGQRTLVFTVTVAQAERMCEVFNRYKPGSAQFVTGKTPKDARRDMFKAYNRGAFQYLINVGVATEGFDDDGIEFVVVGRPTKSRALYAQMVGRGTRPLTGTVDGLETPQERRDAILRSGKKCVQVIDFMGNAGKHRLMTTADILGGNESEEVIACAATIIDRSRDGMDTIDALKEASEKIRAEALAREAEESKRRKGVKAKVRFDSRFVDPFDVFDMEPAVSRGWDRAKKLSKKQHALLVKQGMDPDHMSYAEGKQVLDELFRRWDKDLCTVKQARVLKRNGLDTELKFNEASEAIDGIFAGRR
jgi:superfamily II DNA or RNA helicase